MVIQVADLFAGAGGTTSGARAALEGIGILPRMTAVNHWDLALLTHAKNHPDARHVPDDLFRVDPLELYPDGKLDLLLASPSCTEHSYAKGNRSRDSQARATAECVIRWAEALRPKTILVENVPAFKRWGPLLPNGLPDKRKLGQTFRQWVASLEALGYIVEHRVLCAADYGDPTDRRRLFIQAQLPPREIVWPEQMFWPRREANGRPVYRSAGEHVIDWSIPMKSIFGRPKPLVDNTLRRIAKGLDKIGLAGVTLDHLKGAQPFMVDIDNQSAAGGYRGCDQPVSTVVSKAKHLVCVPFLVTQRGTTDAHLDASAKPVEEPLGTVTASGNHTWLCQPWIVTQRGKSTARDAKDPLSTVTSGRNHAVASAMIIPQHSGGAVRPAWEPMPTVCGTGSIALVRAFVTSYYKSGGTRDITEPLPTATSKSRFGLVLPELVIGGEKVYLDIHYRMLEPHELAASMSFESSYEILGTKTQQCKQIGNAVPRLMAKALVRAAWTQNSRTEHEQLQTA